MPSICITDPQKDHDVLCAHQTRHINTRLVSINEANPFISSLFHFKHTKSLAAMATFTTDIFVILLVLMNILTNILNNHLTALNINKLTKV